MSIFEFIVLVGILAHATPSDMENQNTNQINPKTTVTIGCPAMPSKDPEFTFDIRNDDTYPIEYIQELPAGVMFDLIVKNSSGGVEDHTLFSAGPRMPGPLHTIKPGKSIRWHDYVDPKIQENIPLHLFGYDLSAGQYTVQARIHGWGVSDSNICNIVVK